MTRTHCGISPLNVGRKKEADVNFRITTNFQLLLWATAVSENYYLFKQKGIICKKVPFMKDIS